MSGTLPFQVHTILKTTRPSHLCTVQRHAQGHHHLTVPFHSPLPAPHFICNIMTSSPQPTAEGEILSQGYVDSQTYDTGHWTDDTNSSLINHIYSELWGG